MTSMSAALVALVCWPTTPALGQVVLKSDSAFEYRGSSVRGAHVWVSGRGGRFAHSGNDGRSFTTGSVPGGDSLVLVDVEALSDTDACVIGSSFVGGLARAFLTQDAGRNWSTVFERRHPEVFLDGMAFWDGQRGVAFGDPVAGAFHILRTDSGCRSWTELPRDSVPAPTPGEAGFAASGTAIATAGDRHAWIGTGGGPVARVLRTIDGGQSWSAHDTPLAGGAGGGIFGIAFRDTVHGMAVGGNYQNPADTAANVLATSDGGLTWRVVGRAAPAGVRYGVRYEGNGRGSVVAAVGPSGFGYSRDGGRSWTAVDTLNAFTVAITARAAWTAGPNGRIVRYDPAPWAR
jgi:photosystem II stability/assembly factor-like uncharacterized protein